jgi:FKBP-type peptidyl-prolyl cis-trans isomerase
MAKKSQRIIALSAAILFILTSVGFTGAVIWQMNQENKAVNDAQPLEEQQGGLKGTQLQGFTPIPDVTELQKIDLAVGTGAEVVAGATIVANYTGAIASTGKIFESSLDSGQPVTFGLDQVIPGWTQGVPGMKEGGKRRLIIPSELAYGAQSPSPDIPANSDLVFDIELISIK